jgi:DNA-binding GntR family transcriptional regulator
MTNGTSSLAHEAYRVVRQRIMRGELSLGQVISRRKLATELGMSFLPVSEALQRLEVEGLLESRPRAGTRVRVPGEADVRELYELREALETQAARLFAQRATPEQRLEVRRLADQVDAFFGRLATDDDPALKFAVHSHHVELHLRIAEHARSALLKQMIERKHVLILNWLFDVAGRRTPLPAGFHAQLAQALVSGDVDRADAAMRAHVQYGLVEITSRIGALAASEWRERRGASLARGASGSSHA